MNDSKSTLLSYELELYKQLNKYEEEYRNKYSDKVFKSITVVISIIGAVIWLLYKFTTLKYTEKQHYIKEINIKLLVVIVVILIILVFTFFIVLYGYRERIVNPGEIKTLLSEYKSKTYDEKEIIIAMDESLLMTYKRAAISNHKQNKNRSTLFNIFYILVAVELLLLTIVYAMEVLM